VRERLRGGALRLRIGPFVFVVGSPFAELAPTVHRLYAEHAVDEGERFGDFRVRVAPPRGPRRWLRPQALFWQDGWRPFKPFPRAHAYPLLEWGLNWVVAASANRYLLVHAAVCERGGRAVVIPGAPGSGKSTLCAALAASGWRLLSDELALFSVEDGALYPLPRPISLKNESIDVVRSFHPGAVLGPLHHDTQKGTVAHLKPPAESVARGDEPARAAWLVHLSYRHGERARLEQAPKVKALWHLAENAFNYNVLGRRGFELAADFVDGCECLKFTYGDLREAVTALDALAGGAAPLRATASSSPGCFATPIASPA